MIPVVKTPPSTRPHTFGRSSNVWQYLDLVHDRNSPLSAEPLSALNESTDGEESEEEVPAPKRGRERDEREHRHQGSHDFGGKRGSKEGSVANGDGIKRHSKTRKGSSALLANIASFPDLHHSSQQGSKKMVALSGSSSSALVGAGLRVVGGSNINSAEIIKRLNALGTSSSAPLIPPVSPSNNGHGNESPTNGSNQVIQLSQATGSTLTAAAPAAPGPASVVGAATNVAPVSDAEKLLNDFNSQSTRLSYGCSVALELFNGHLMMVGSPDGRVRVQSLEKLQTPQTKGYKDRAIMTLLDLADVRSAGSIRYGDSVWLQLSVGPGDVSWEQGGVLGAKVREAPQLKALGLLDDDSIRNDVQAPTAVGYPIPVKAYLPKSRDEGDMQVDDVQSRFRNKSAKMLGKWTIRSAVCQRRKQKDNFVYNNDEVYLEQDWFYLGADSDAGVAVLRQLPPAVVGKDIKPGEYVVERRGAWKLRLLDSSSGSAGLSLAQQQMERLLLRAKSQLKQSQRMRSGQTKVYGPNLRGGTGFTAQLRAQVAASTRQTESRYADQQEWRLKRIDQHMSEKARSMNMAIGFESTASRNDSRPTSGLSAGGKSTNDKVEPQEPEQRKRALLRSISVDSIGTGGRQPSAALQSPETNLRDVKGVLTLSSLTLPNPVGTGSSCALCHSSSIGYNLCCQFRDVMDRLEQERLGVIARKEEEKLQQNVTPGESGIAPGTRRTARTRTGRTARTARTARSDGMLTTRKNQANGPALESTARDTVRHGGPDEVRGYIASSTNAQPPNERILQLFAKEDAAMVGLIKYKEKEAYQALYAETQTQATFSPAAALFRDRFKHIGVFVQMHRQQQHQHQVQQDGIGGQFQKLHADLYSAGRRRTVVDVSDYDSIYDSDDDYADSDDEPQDPLIQPQPSVELREENEESSGVDPDRLFPTPKELAQLTPVDTKAALALYVQNRTAMAEMLDGYAELVDSQMIPMLRDSLITRNRGALVEVLDFVARASEFVCARRVQVFVAKLLHAVAESDVGDFTSFQKDFDELLTEMHGAVNFVRFFLQKRVSRHKQKAK